MIVRNYRKAVSFQRVDSVFHPLMNSVHSYHQSKQKKLGSRWPTFPEFVDFLLSEAKTGAIMDMHWTPVAKFCTPCQVKFDVIAKFETLEEDQRYLIDKAGLGNVIKPEHKNSGKGKKTNELLMSHYAQLTKSQVKGIFQIFKYDFELFDYSPNEFFKVAQDTAPTTQHDLEVNGAELRIDKSKVLPLSS